MDDGSWGSYVQGSVNASVIFANTDHFRVFAFNDANGNGVPDAGDPQILAAEVYVPNADLANVTLDSLSLTDVPDDLNNVNSKMEWGDPLFWRQRGLGTFRTLLMSMLG